MLTLNPAVLRNNKSNTAGRPGGCADHPHPLTGYQDEVVGQLGGWVVGSGGRLVGSVGCQFPRALVAGRGCV